VVEQEIQRQPLMDKLSANLRSENMRRIRSSGTRPEMLVRRLAHGMGYRFRLHRKDLVSRIWFSPAAVTERVNDSHDDVDGLSSTAS